MAETKKRKTRAEMIAEIEAFDFSTLSLYKLQVIEKCTWVDLNGVKVPQWLVNTPPEELDPEKVLGLENAQQRAEGIKLIGLERMWFGKVKIIDQWGNYELGDLPIGNSRTGRYLKMENPSVPDLWHVEGVPSAIKTVKEAINWRKPEAMTRIPINDKDGEEWYQQGDVCVWPKKAKSLREMPSILT
jgi:hypothetical protein